MHLPQSFPVFHVGIPGGFQVMVPDKTLDRADIDRGGDERILHKLFVDLCGVEPRECLLKAVDLLDGSVRQHPVDPLSERSFGINASIPPVW